MDSPRLAPAASGPSLRQLALAALCVLAAMAAGQIGTNLGVADWYPTLRKPFFTPPNTAFPIVWPALYALMAFAFWRILRLPEKAQGRDRAIGLFLAQLVLNAAWSWAFFAFRSPAAGLAVIIPLEALIILTALAFWRLDRIAGLSLAPYAAWVAFATALNLGILLLN